MEDVHEARTPLISVLPPGRAKVIRLVSWFISSTAVTVSCLANSIVFGKDKVFDRGETFCAESRERGRWVV